jgi:hypothetical protein
MKSTSPRLPAAGVLLLLLLTGCVGASPDVPRVDEQSTPPPDSVVASDVEAVIVVAGVDVDGKNVTVSGYAAGILEDGGECIYSFTGMTAETSATAEGRADRSVTTCGSTQVPIEQFARGTWEVTMRYVASDGTETASPPTTLEIP